MKKVLGICIIVVIMIALLSIIDNGHRGTIAEKITSMNGQLVEIENKSILSSQPFKWVNAKSDQIYKFQYIIDGEQKDGWVIFRAFKTEWKFE